MSHSASLKLTFRQSNIQNRSFSSCFGDDFPITKMGCIAVLKRTPNLVMWQNGHGNSRGMLGIDPWSHQNCGTNWGIHRHLKCLACPHPIPPTLSHSIMVANPIFNVFNPYIKHIYIYNIVFPSMVYIYIYMYIYICIYIYAYIYICIAYIYIYV